MILGEGTVTLVGGRATVPVTKIPMNAKVLLTRAAAGGTIGDLRHSLVTDKASFNIESTNILDTSQVHWMVMV